MHFVLGRLLEEDCDLKEFEESEFDLRREKRIEREEQKRFSMTIKYYYDEPKFLRNPKMIL